MSQRRMFSADIVDSDAFLDMPSSSQLLYFHLSMRADDDGFVNPKKVMRMMGASDDDLKVLLLKRFLLSFETGVVVIKHWLIHNLIRADLYKETLYKQEKTMLGLNDNGGYTELREGVSEIKQVEAPEWLIRRRGNKRTANVPQTALRLGKDRLGKDREEEKKISPKEITIQFFEDVDKNFHTLDPLIASLEKEKNVARSVAESEIRKFASYWTELTPNGKSQRWEKEKTFEVQKRLNNWFRNADKWSKGSGITNKRPNVIF